MEDLLFVLFVALILWGMPRIGFIRRSGLSVSEARVLLGIKIITGVLFALSFKYFSPNIDYIHINEEGIGHYRLLINEPRNFFKDVSIDMQQYGIGGLFETKNSFWAYIRFTLMYKVMAVVNLLTRGDFIFNTALFSSLVFFGHMAFFRVFYAMYPSRRWLIIFTCFFLPSVLIYTACIHKDGIIFLCLGLLSYLFSRLLHRTISGRWQYLAITIFCLLGIFVFRNYVLVALLPALLVAIVCVFTHWDRRLVLGGCYLLFTGGFFFTGLVQSSFNLPAAVVQRKADFAALETGTTTIQMNNLHPTITSFAKNLPQALNHVLLRPYPWEFSQPSVILTALELLLYQLIFILFILYRKKGNLPVHPFNIFGIAFFINMVLIIGYTIPNIGAIVRYRSIFWVFILCPLLCNIDWKRLSLSRSVKK